MRIVVIAPGAQRQMREALVWSRDTFGVVAADRYRRLIEAAAAELADNPDRRGVVQCPNDLRTFHLKLASHKHGVAAPRHILVFRSDDRVLTVIRVFHDAMDLPARLSDV